MDGDTRNVKLRVEDENATGEDRFGEIHFFKFTWIIKGGCWAGSPPSPPNSATALYGHLPPVSVTAPPLQ